MIKDIEQIKELGYPKAVEFLEGCRIYEKIDMFYFKVKIISKNSVDFYKANGSRIELKDIILSSMWKNPINELSKVLLSNQEQISKFVGYTFGFFYLPCEIPLKTDYTSLFIKNKARYIFSDVFNPSGKRIDIKKDLSIKNNIFLLLKDYKSIWIYNSELYKDKPLNEKFSFDRKELKNLIENKDSKFSSIKELVLNTLTYKSEKLSKQWLFADDTPEGYILKCENLNYQISFHSPVPQNYTEQSKVGMEFVITDFCRWIKEYHTYGDLINSSYEESICNLFEAYIKTKESKLSAYYNLTPEELEAPTFGYYSGTGYEYIPNKFVKEICQESKLKENIFKILLNGLKKQKQKDNYMLITQETKDVWNQLVRTIQISTMGNYGLNLK